MGLEVDDDQECPVAIRCRHAKSILDAVSKRMNENTPQTPQIPSCPSTHMESRHVVIDQGIRETKENIPRFWKELASGLDIAPPKPRHRPSFNEYNDISLSDDEVSTICTVDQDISKRSDDPVDSNSGDVHIVPHEYSGDEKTYSRNKKTIRGIAPKWPDPFPGPDRPTDEVIASLSTDQKRQVRTIF